MKCSVCQTENREGVKFCSKCGATMSGVAIQADTNLNTCPKCESSCKPDAKFCPKCGHNFSPQMAKEPEIQQEPGKVVSREAVVCPSCGSGVKDNAKFCLKCGHSLSSTPSSPISPIQASPAALDEKEPSSQESFGIQTEASSIASQPVPHPEKIPSRVEPDVVVTPLASEGKKKNIPTAAAIALGVTGLVIAIGIGAFLMHQKRQGVSTTAQTSSEAATKSPVAIPTAPAVTSKPEVPITAPASESAPHPSIENPGQEKVPTSSPSPATAVQATLPVPLATEHKPTPKTAPIKPKVSQPDAENNTIQKAVSDSLEDGTRCMKLKRYDCAIANANAVLRISPNNARALDMKRRAKDEQEKALSQINIE